MIWITGDTHRDFSRFDSFCRYNGTTKDDLMIVFGDAALNFSGEKSDRIMKYEVSRLPLTFLFIRGNHEERAESIKSYKRKEWHGREILVEDDFSSLLFAIDGEIYDIGGLETITIGGAYSIDKETRILYEPLWGKTWWEDKQLSVHEKRRITKKLKERDWKIDCVLSHTAPLKYEPRELFLEGVIQSEVDKSMEQWLDGIEDKLEYKHWWFGHYHGEKDKDNMTMLFTSIRPWPNNL